MADWPATLPQNLLYSGYSESVANNRLKSSVDEGPAKIRRRTTANTRPLNGRILVDNTQLATFIEFYNTTLVSGSLRFSWVWP